MKDPQLELLYAQMVSRCVINRDALSDEVARQPELYRECQEVAVTARSRAVLASDDLKTMEAKLYRSIAAKRETGGERSTEAVLKHLVQEHPKRRAAFEEMLAAEETAKRWETLSDTFRKRHYSLHDLCELQIAGMLDSRSVAGPAIAKVQEQAHEQARERMSKGRKSAWREKL